MGVFDKLFGKKKEPQTAKEKYSNCVKDKKEEIQNKEIESLLCNDDFKNTIKSIKEYRHVYGYGMGQERELTVLYFSSQIGYFFIQQVDSNAGTYYRWLLLPNNISNCETYYIEHVDEFSDWMVGWYSNKFESDMTS